MKKNIGVCVATFAVCLGAMASNAAALYVWQDARGHMPGLTVDANGNLLEAGGQSTNTMIGATNWIIADQYDNGVALPSSRGVLFVEVRLPRDPAKGEWNQVQGPGKLERFGDSVRTADTQAGAIWRGGPTFEFNVFRYSIAEHAPGGVLIISRVAPSGRQEMWTFGVS